MKPTFQTLSTVLTLAMLLAYRERVCSQSAADDKTPASSAAISAHLRRGE